MREALIVDAVRSPIGKRNGSLSKIRADELAGQVLNRLVERHELGAPDRQRQAAAVNRPRAGEHRVRRDA